MHIKRLVKLLNLNMFKYFRIAAQEQTGINGLHSEIHILSNSFGLTATGFPFLN